MSPIDGAHPAADQGFLPFGGPLIGGGGADDGALELGHHISSQQLEAVKHLFSGRPVDGLD